MKTIQKTHKRTLAVLLILAVAFVSLLAAPINSKAKADESDPIVRIGVSLPSLQPRYWSKLWESIQDKFNGCDEQLIVRDAQNNAAQQVHDIYELLDMGIDVLIVVPVDVYAIAQAIDEAGNRGIPVISYDRIPMNTMGATCHVTFDYEEIGAIQAQFIIDELQRIGTLENSNIGVFGGPPYSPIANDLYNGAMSVFNQYPVNIIFNERIEWSQDVAKDTMTNQLTAHDNIDAVLCPTDIIAAGVIKAILESGRDFPIITGMVDDTEAVICNLNAGYQTMTVFTNPRAVAAVLAYLARSIIAGSTLQLPDFTDNNAKMVPTYVIHFVPGGTHAGVIIGGEGTDGFSELLWYFDR